MPVNVNIPFQVTIAADGSVSIQKVDVQTYTLTEANATFEGYLRDDILHAFKVEQNGANPNAALYVTMVNGNKPAFIDELKKQILQASMENGSVALTDLNIKNLEAYLLEWANSNLLEELKKNGIADALEADALDNLVHNGFEADAEKGATAMHDGLDAMEPSRLSVVASQIPNSKWMSAFNSMGDSGMPGSRSAGLVNRLPLEDGGDSMTFQFVITQNFLVSESNPVSGASMMPVGANIPGGAVVNTGIAPSGDALLGHYSVPTRIINLKLSRSQPSTYGPAGAGNLKGLTYTPPSAADTGVAWNVDQCEEAINNTTDGTLKLYNDAVIVADASFNAWNNANGAHNTRVLADKRVSDATAFEAAARQAQTTALAQAGSDTTGPLYDAAQRAIVAAAKALTDLSDCLATQVTAVAADFGGAAGTSAAAATEVERLLGLSKDATESVTSSFKDLTNSQNALAAARVALARQAEWIAHQQAKHDAAQESANTAAQVALDQWSDASENAISARSDLETARVELNSADAIAQAWETERSSAEAAYVTDKSEASATRLKVAQDKKNEKAAILALKAAEFLSKHAVATKKSSAANTALNTYVTASSYSDSPSAPGFAGANEFDVPAVYSYDAPSTPVGLPL